ncbi:MAG: hypothetical protein ACI9XO_000162 [Paraglaciecola sp.]|jgi:hypothetical protein
MLKITSNLFLISLSLLILGCEKISTDPVFSTTPAIKITEISQDTLVQFVDKLILKIEYEDGDGDLGNANPDINSIFVKDSRLEAADEYYLPPLAPDSAFISITGVFNLELSTTFLFGNGTEESAVFEIFIMDRAGNRSEAVETTPILIVQ